MLAQNFVRDRFSALVLKLAEDEAFLFKKYSRLFKGITLPEIEDIRALTNNTSAEKTKFCIDLIEIDDSFSLSLVGWAFSNGASLTESDFSIYLIDDKLPFIFQKSLRPDVSAANAGPIDCGFKLTVKTFKHYIGSNEKLMIRLKESRAEFENPYIKKARLALDKAMALRESDDFCAVESTFRDGMRDYPSFVDRFGHPAFKKELVWILLSKRRFADALQLISQSGGTSDDSWHEILFARIYTRFNEVENARLWWGKVVKRKPNHPEAMKFFAKFGVPPELPKNNAG
ncbi:hypothetical protein [Methylocucumis oryzae]|uniref:Uncharacterized protein n=1 Tax=Methylocucumis oryzae TaxID=1632867 RepID=A0A0F3II49_9GAMM|nr:hypothetical protein [Methylocucumis oryzae]KJV06342.1 hypothetical protein VZ94_11950 [Methylocucumis oryzae]